MKKSLSIILLIVILAPISGCASRDKPSEYEKLQEQGYGFGNPANDRRLEKRRKRREEWRKEH